MNIAPLTQNNFSAAIALLKKNNLPTQDISDVTKLFVLEDEQTIAGTIALEYSGTEGLLRSLSVDEKRRNSGYGKELVDFVENYAKRQGITDLYLLTTTADRFFLKRGYEVVDRNNVPAYIKETSEFSSICPSS